MNDSAKKTIAALTAAVVVLTVLLGGATAAAVIFAVQRNDATAWFYVDGELYRTVTAKDGKVDCPDVPAVSDTVFDGWYADADHSGSRVSFPADIDGDTAFFARRISAPGTHPDYSAASLAIDGGTVVSDRIKPLHGVNNGPVSGFGIFDEPYADASDYFAEMGVPFVRLHDTEFPFGRDEYVDIHCVFPLFCADAADASNYDFAATDEYVRAIQSAVPDAEIIYRLGESIDHTGDGGHAVMPDDFDQWAKICVEVVRHYLTQFGIRYYEIWNEPDQPSMWDGTIEQYYELYRVTSQALRAEFGDAIEIGGPALATSTVQTIERFLDAVDGYPLDFLSVHAYCGDPSQFASAQYAEFKDMLSSRGYADAMLILDEWNFVSGWDDASLSESYDLICSDKSGAFIAASLIALQNSAIDAAAYYDAQMTGLWCGLYYKPYFDIGNERLAELLAAYADGGADALNSLMRELLAPYADLPLAPLSGMYAMSAYDRLYSMTSPMQLEVTTSGDGLWALAVTDVADGTTGLLVANCSDVGKAVVTHIKGADIDDGTVVAGTVWECSADGAAIATTVTDGAAVFDLAPYSFAYFEVTGV